MERFGSISAAEAVWSGPTGSAGGGRAASLVIPIRRVRDDALPENIRYEDRGCEVAPRCLECPLPRCRYDEPGGLRGLLNRDRDRRIAELRSASGGRVPVDELAGRFKVSRRTVFRVLRKTAASLRESGRAKGLSRRTGRAGARRAHRGRAPA
jgi:hypothetical protein